MKNILVAYDRNHAIGNGVDLPWGRDLPADLRRVRELTTGHTIVMGRKTFKSIGRALPNRQNIVVSRTLGAHEGIDVTASLNEAYSLATSDEVFVFGGAQLYELSVAEVDRIYATEVQAEFPGMSVYFPSIDAALWKEKSRVHHKADERNKYDFDFVVYERVRL